MLLLLSAFVANKGIHSFIHYPPNTKISYENPSTTFSQTDKTVCTPNRGSNCLNTDRDHFHQLDDARDGDSFHVNKTSWLCLYALSVNQLWSVSFLVLLLWTAFPTVAVTHTISCSVNIII